MPAGSLTGASNGDTRRGAVHASAALLAQALASDDAEATGMRAAEVLADPEAAVAVLGGPDAVVAARHAVVQRYGRVGALLVVAYEERWRRGHAGVTAAARPPGTVADESGLEELIEQFADLDTAAVAELLVRLDEAEGLAVHDELASARRWLHATYAVAARDGTDTAHRAYMVALDRIMRLAAPRLAS